MNYLIPVIQRILHGAACRKLQDAKGVNSGKPVVRIAENGNPEPSQVNGHYSNLEGAETKK